MVEMSLNHDDLHTTCFGSPLYFAECSTAIYTHTQVKLIHNKTHNVFTFYHRFFRYIAWTVSLTRLNSAAEKCIITTGGNCRIGLGYNCALARAGARVAIVYRLSLATLIVTIANFWHECVVRSSADAPKVVHELQDKYKVKVQVRKQPGRSAILL
jgi:hypothetical protein